MITSSFRFLTVLPISITGAAFNTVTDVLTLTVNRDCTLHALHSASATQMTAPAIMAGAEISPAVLAGEAFINWDDSAWGAGTWYLHVAAIDANGQTAVIAPIQHILAAPFVTSAVRFDGTNDWLSGTGLTTPAASKFGTFGIAFRIPSPWPAGGPYVLSFQKAGSSTRFYLGTNRNSDGVTLSSGRVTINVYDDAGSGNGSFATGDFEMAADAWMSLAVTYDSREAVTANRWRVRRANGAGAWGEPTFAYTNIMPLDMIIGAAASAVVGAVELNGDFKMNAFDMAYLYYAPGQLADLTDTAVLEKFRASNGGRAANGSGITGTQPFMFLEDTTLATFKTNKGTGGGLTENGALTVSAGPLP